MPDGQNLRPNHQRGIKREIEEEERLLRIRDCLQGNYLRVEDFGVKPIWRGKANGSFSDADQTQCFADWFHATYDAVLSGGEH
jgi:hypothetical protein